MKKESVKLGSLQLLGLTARTNNQDEFNPNLAKIPGMVGLYFGRQVANQFKHRKNPGVTYAIYTEFESDEHGEYTYFIGEEVDAFTQQNTKQFKQLIVPASQYQKFTTPQGQMPQVVIEAWQTIWQMGPADFGGKRKYIADFEVYDQRAVDPSRTVIDIYIGIE